VRILAFLFGSFAYINALTGLACLAMAAYILVGLTPEMILKLAQRLPFMAPTGLSDIHRFLESGGLERWSLYIALFLVVAAMQSGVATGAWWRVQSLTLAWHRKPHVTPELVQHLKKLTLWLVAGSAVSLMFLGLDAFLGTSKAIIELFPWVVKNSLRPAETMEEFALLINDATSPSQLLMQQLNDFVSLSGIVVYLFTIVSFASSKWAQHWMELQRRQESLEAENALIV
jgi:hypothetical protein